MYAIFAVECSDCKMRNNIVYNGDAYMKKLEEAGQPEDCESCGSTNVSVKKVEEQR